MPATNERRSCPSTVTGPVPNLVDNWLLMSAPEVPCGASMDSSRGGRRRGEPGPPTKVQCRVMGANPSCVLRHAIHEGKAWAAVSGSMWKTLQRGPACPGGARLGSLHPVPRKAGHEQQRRLLWAPSRTVLTLMQ